LPRKNLLATDIKPVSPDASTRYYATLCNAVQQIKLQQNTDQYAPDHCQKCTRTGCFPGQGKGKKLRLGKIQTPEVPRNLLPAVLGRTIYHLRFYNSFKILLILFQAGPIPFDPVFQIKTSFCR
jgi:hypothetical protein